MPTFTPIDHDPFAGPAKAPKVVPVDHNPFEEEERGSFINPLMEGVTLGWGDELAAAGGATYGVLAPESWGGLPDNITWSEAYDGIRDHINTDTKAYAKRNPKSALALELMGGLTTGGVGMSRTMPKAGASFLNRTARYGGTGAATGGVAGAGYSEPGQRLEGGVEGAMVGGTVGTVLPVAGSGARGAGRFVHGRMQSGASGSAQQKVGDDLVKAGYEAPETAIERLRELGPDATVADLSERTLTTAEGAAQYPGAAREAAQFFQKRGVNSGRRVAHDIDQLFGGRVSVHSLIDDVISRSAKESEPLYTKAMAQPVQVNETLQNILKTPAAQQALRRASSIAANEGQELSGQLDMRAWDLIKKGLDDVIDRAGRTSMGKMTESGRAVLSVKRRLVAELDRQNPIYKEARMVYAGHADTKKAAEEGLKFFNKSEAEIDHAMKTMSQSELDAYRLGAMQRLYDEAKKTTDAGSAYKRLSGDASKRDRIKLVLQDDEALSQLESALLREQTYLNTLNTTRGNSATARREASMAEGVPANIPATKDGLASAMVNWGARKLQKPTDSQMDELARLLMTPGKGAENAVQEAMQRRLASDLRYRAMGSGTSVYGGMASGRETAR